MKTAKFRVGALAAGAMLAVATVLGAVALQDDGQSASHDPAGDSPIVYTGGYGLFPVGQ